MIKGSHSRNLSETESISGYASFITLCTRRMKSLIAATEARKYVGASRWLLWSSRRTECQMVVAVSNAEMANIPIVSSNSLVECHLSSALAMCTADIRLRHSCISCTYAFKMAFLCSELETTIIFEQCIDERGPANYR